VTRLARVIAVDVPHHVTQRGNGRRFILNSEADRTAYLNLLRQNIELHGVGLIVDRLLPDVESRASGPHSSQW
jgi:putative transposase